MTDLQRRFLRIDRMQTPESERMMQFHLDPVCVEVTWNTRPIFTITKGFCVGIYHPDFCSYFLDDASKDRLANDIIQQFNAIKPWAGIKIDYFHYDVEHYGLGPCNDISIYIPDAECLEERVNVFGDIVEVTKRVVESKTFKDYVQIAKTLKEDYTCRRLQSR